MDSLLETYIGRIDDILNELEEMVEDADDPGLTAVASYIDQMKAGLSEF